MRAKNVNGYGAFSNEITLTASSVPDTMGLVTVTRETTNIKFAWSAPSSDIAITDYTLLLYQPDTNSYGEDTSLCDATTAQLYCTVAIADLISDYGYAIADLPKAKAYATNANGDGGESTPNSSGDTIALIPQVAPTPSYSARTATTIDLTWDALTTNAQTGGLTILSYILEYDQGTSTWTTLQGDPTDSTLTTYSLTGLTAGTAYAFRVTAQNDIGNGPTSSEVSITPMAVPDTPSAPTVTLDEPYAKISWSAPTDNGSTITAYTITIIQSDGSTFTEETTYCDGSDSTVISQLYCQVPMTTLAASPYSLTYGTDIKAKVSATNAVGTSGTSGQSTSFTQLETVPVTMGAVSSGSSTDDTQIEVSWSALSTDADTGGSAITSYQIQWDSGTAGVTYTTLQGLSPYSTLTSYTVNSGLTGGQDYKFRVRARNLYGWGPYSSVTTINASA